MTRSCGADTPVREMPAAKKNSMWRFGTRQQLVRLFGLFVDTMREIFEESAYERFLARTQMQSSPDAYSDFLRETEAAKARRPRCC